MKKKLTLLLFSILCTIGAWADTTVKIADYANYQPWGASSLITRSTDKICLTTTELSGVAGAYVFSSGSSTDGYWDRTGNWLLLIPKNTTESTFTITMVAPSGYVISGYTIDLCSWNIDRTYVVTASNGTTKTTSNNTIQTLTLNSLSTRTESITVKANACTTNNYFTIKNMSITLTPAPNIPEGDYILNVEKIDATKYYSFMKPSVEQYFTDNVNNVADAGVFALTRVDKSYDTYYIKELSSNKYLYAVNADKADYDNNGNVTTYGASSTNKYRFHTGTYSGNLMKAIDLGDLPEGDKSAYKWKILSSSISPDHYVVVPISNTNTSLGMWTSVDTYYSFLEPSYGWSQVKFYSMKDATQAYLTDKQVKSKMDYAGKVGYPKLTNTSYVALGGLITSFESDTYSSTLFSSLKTNYTSYYETTDVVKPAIGKFYTIYNPNANKFIHSVTPGNTLALNASGTDAAAIFYVIGSDTRLLSYSNGYAMGEIQIWNDTYESGGYYTYTIDHVISQDFGTLRINYSNYSFYQNSTTVGNTSQDATRTGAKAAWVFTEVTSLPITMHEVDGAYYGTINLPVAVEIPAGLSAYSATASGNLMSLTKVVEDGVLAANTPVVLYSEGNVTSLDIASTAGTAAVGNELSGTTAAISVTANDNYVLNCVNDEVGFYKFNGTEMPGFKAYLTSANAASVKAFAFSFEDVEDAIRAIESENSGLEIYDIAGRRVQKAQKGLYIVNGKKVMYK